MLFSAMIEEKVPGREGDVLKAVLLGDRSGLSSDFREIFARSGTAHLLAISGLHVGLIAMIFLSILLPRTHLMLQMPHAHQTASRHSGFRRGYLRSWGWRSRQPHCMTLDVSDSWLCP